MTTTTLKKSIREEVQQQGNICRNEVPELDVNKINADVVLDLRGVSCPLPPLKTLKALGKLTSGQVLEVLGTSPMGRRSAPWIAQKLGNQMIGYVESDGYYRIFYEKS